MDLKLTGKKAIITGGSRGIGRAIARQLALEGVDCTICSRTESELRQTAEELQQETSRKFYPIVADMTKSDSIQNMINKAAEYMGGIDILVNNGARVSGGEPESFNEVKDELILRDFEEKFLGYFRCIRGVVPYMKGKNWGRIINISGMAARMARSISAGARNVSVIHLTKTSAQELGKFGINVNAIYPATTVTENIRKRFPTDEMLEKEAKKNAINKLVTADEIGFLVAFLASPLSVAITGDVISATGGRGNTVYY